MPVFDETCTSTDGLRLHARAWLPEDMTGILAFSHGLGEHIGRYERFAQAMNKEGFGLYMADLHGHGKTEGKRGHITNWEQSLLADLKVMLSRAAELAEGRAVFFGGHSLGGLNAARLLIENPPGVRGGIIMSPAIKQVMNPPEIVIAVSKGIASIAPSFQVSNMLDYEGLSRDPSVVAAYNADPLVYKRISVKAFLEMVRTQEIVLAKAAEVTTPCLIIHGTADRLTDHRKTVEFFEMISSPDKTIRLFEGYYHETHNDLDADLVYLDIINWMKVRSE